MRIVEAARGTCTFMVPDFLPILTNAIVAIRRVIHESPAACLFTGITRASPAVVLQRAVADFEAMRLGWPGAEWARPGRCQIPGPFYGEWIILPIDHYPERQAELLNEFHPRA